jgi:class 3 adenylate cyclase
MKDHTNSFAEIHASAEEHLQKELELEKRIFHLKTLYDVSQVIGSLRDVQGIIKNLLMMVMGTFGVRRGILFLVGLQHNRLEASTHRGIDDSVIAQLSQAIHAGHFHRMKDLTEILSLDGGEHQGNESAQVYDILSASHIRLWIPFTITAQISGGIGLGEKLSGEPYSTDDKELLSTLATQLTMALDNALAYQEIEDLNRGLEEKVRQRTAELRRQHEKLKETNAQLELRNQFIRSTFGRYVSDEVVASLLESPERLQLGGERRKVTILMSDLRGFTSLAERLAPEQIVTIVNRYLGTMVDIILKYQGTINEFIGDAILVIFGAPIQRADDAERAIACAVAMQLAMTSVNAKNRREGLPEVEMGIGIHTGEVVVGNIGSRKRTKYGIVGSPVNLTSRIESYTVGGQILTSETTFREIGSILTVGNQLEITAKGIEKPLTLYDVRGIGGEHALFLPDLEEQFVSLPRAIPLRYAFVDGKHLDGTVFEGQFVTLSVKGGKIRSNYPVPPLSNLKIKLMNTNGEELPGNLYGKVIGPYEEDLPGFSVRFTSLTPDISILKLLRLGKAAIPKGTGRRPSTLRSPASWKHV